MGSLSLTIDVGILCSFTISLANIYAMLLAEYECF